MSEIGTGLIAHGSAQVIEMTLRRPEACLPVVGSATIIYRQFEWSYGRQFRLEICSVEAATMCRQSLYREEEFRLDVYRPEARKDWIERLWARWCMFVGWIGSDDIAFIATEDVPHPALA